MIAVDMHDNTIVRTYPVGGSPQRIAVSWDGAEVYIASEAVGLEILNTGTGNRETISAVPPGSVGLALSPDQAVIYVTNPPAGELHIVARAARQLVKTLAGLVTPRNVAFAAGGRVAIVAGEGNVVYFVR